jgi:hypothetical protein
MEEKYNFEILFQKLEEVKEEQKDYKILDITSEKELDESLKVLKAFNSEVQDIQYKTYTRS